jgi:hypothetical protein
MTEIYNKLSENYDSLYLENLIHFQKEMLKVSSGTQGYVHFYPSFGIKNTEHADFIVYGQAVNGWSSEFCLTDQMNIDRVLEGIWGSNKYLKSKNHTPLDWVNVQWSNSIYNMNCEDAETKNYYDGKYLSHRSFFWNVTYKLICDYYEIKRNGYEWSKKLVWSNLYKIAPESSNPDNHCKVVQQVHSVNLVKKEIEEISPKYCIVLTNLDWWLPFRNGLNTKIIGFPDSLDEIVSFEKYLDTKIIVTNRPYTGNSEKFVEQILTLIK